MKTHILPSSTNQTQICISSRKKIPSLIYTRYHEKGITKIRQIAYGEDARTCRSIIGYDDNALYVMQDMLTGWYTRRREENGFRPESAQLHLQMTVERLTWEAERTGLSIRHQVNGREKRIGKYREDRWCSETRTTYQFQGCYYHGCPCLGLEMNVVKGSPRVKFSQKSARHGLPSTLCQGSRDVGMSEERPEKSCGRETAPGRRVSSSTTREMEHDATSDLGRRVSRYHVRYDRGRRSFTVRIALEVRRDAARVQERCPDSRRSRLVHILSLSQRSRHRDSSVTLARG